MSLATENWTNRIMTVGNFRSTDYVITGHYCSDPIIWTSFDLVLELTRTKIPTQTWTKYQREINSIMLHDKLMDTLCFCLFLLSSIRTFSYANGWLIVRWNCDKVVQFIVHATRISNDRMVGTSDRNEWMEKKIISDQRMKCHVINASKNMTVFIV